MLEKTCWGEPLCGPCGDLIFLYIDNAGGTPPPLVGCMRFVCVVVRVGCGGWGFAGLKGNDFCWLLGASGGASFMIF